LRKTLQSENFLKDIDRVKTERRFTKNGNCKSNLSDNFFDSWSFLVCEILRRIEELER
jgi:hypothetical protein